MSKIVTTKSFIENAKQVHGDKYNYSKVVYIGARDKVTITCPIHGDFEQTPNKHMYGGCSLCGVQQASKAKTKHIDNFIENAKQVHGDKYDYSKVVYSTRKSMVTITCPIHGDFEQMAKLHLRGQGCTECGKMKSANSRILSAPHFVETSRRVHGDKYGYDKVSYITSRYKVTITCPIHGDFEQTPSHHTDGQGCPECTKRISNQEIDLRDAISTIYSGVIITNTRSIIPPYEIDILLPDINLAIEYNGMYWHEEGVTKPVGYHQMKTDMCLGMGIKLIHIWEKDWKNNKDEVIRLIADQITEKQYEYDEHKRL